MKKVFSIAALLIGFFQVAQGMEGKEFQEYSVELLEKGEPNIYYYNEMIFKETFNKEDLGLGDRMFNQATLIKDLVILQDFIKTREFINDKLSTFVVCNKAATAGRLIVQFKAGNVTPEVILDDATMIKNLNIK